MAKMKHHVKWMEEGLVGNCLIVLGKAINVLRMRVKHNPLPPFPVFLYNPDKQRKSGVRAART